MLQSLNTLLLRIALALVFGAGSACGPTLRATPPSIPTAVESEPVVQREQRYTNYRLLEDRGLLTSTWHREDGTYDWNGLDALADPHAELRALRSQAALRSTLLAVLLYAGLGTVAVTAGYQWAAPARDELTSGTAAALYVSGASAIGLAVLLRLILPDARRDFAQQYNELLRRDLHLPAEDMAFH